MLPISYTYQCQSVPPISAISAALQCQSVPPNSATYQCHISVPCISASSSVPISVTYQCPSVQPISAHHCSLISAHQ
ncbi:unnamed protein product [Staurois parvus]|uniref:Uncharacterized protein n=1 Tax=Staurois parvus TaxID=386267 RepID=A0ABN9DD35_9NEOB|nr:unnamed protein product [Staurois parvus]